MKIIKLAVNTVLLPIMLCFDAIWQILFFPIGLAICALWTIFPDALWYFFYMHLCVDKATPMRILFWPSLCAISRIYLYIAQVRNLA